MTHTIKIGALFLIILVVSTIACQPSATKNDNTEISPQKAETKRVFPPPTKVTLAATGDIMLHMPQIRAAVKSDGTYDFTRVFKEVTPYLKRADLVFGNFETTLSGTPPYRGYPLFNAPDEIADALKTAGFNVLQTANNHALDSGAKGVIHTYKTLLKKEIYPVGTAITPGGDSAIIEKNGITVGFLAYTYGTNGIPIPKDQPYLVNRIDERKITRDIRSIRASGAEFVVVGLHFGNEYAREPSDEQRSLVTHVFKSGADVVLGGHPHVLQPMEFMEVDGQQKFVIYSLGNALSNQFFNPNVNKGIVLYIDIVKDYETDTVRLDSVTYLPTIVHRFQAGRTGYVILPIEEQYVQEKTIPYRYPGLSFKTIREAWQQTTSHMKRYENFPVFDSSSHTLR